jgi:hypothetical protein
MAIYETENYEVVSIMKKFKNQDSVSTMIQGVLFIQGLPAEDHPYIVPSSIDLEETGLVEADFDNLDRFTANVIPVFNATQYQPSLNLNPAYTISLSNSAISPLSYAGNTILL